MTLYCGRTWRKQKAQADVHEAQKCLLDSLMAANQLAVLLNGRLRRAGCLYERGVGPGFSSKAARKHLHRTATMFTSSCQQLSGGFRGWTHQPGSNCCAEESCSIYRAHNHKPGQAQAAAAGRWHHITSMGTTALACLTEAIHPWDTRMKPIHERAASLVSLLFCLACERRWEPGGYTEFKEGDCDDCHTNSMAVVLFC